MSEPTMPPAPPDTGAGNGSGKIMQTIYEHGGSRIWMQYDDGNRDLLADTYDGEELAKKVRATIEAHFFPNKPDESRTAPVRTPQSAGSALNGGNK